MTDTMTPQQRHRCMSRIRGADTKPEMLVRRHLWRLGYRYRLHVRQLPGTPDIVMRKYRTAIFVNGCFWHGHNVGHGAGLIVDSSECCRIPGTRRDFWAAKIRNNMLRDDENMARLHSMGWHVIVVWECELKPRCRQQTLQMLADRLGEIAHPGGTKRYVFEDPEFVQAAEAEAEYRHN